MKLKSLLIAQVILSLLAPLILVPVAAQDVTILSVKPLCIIDTTLGAGTTFSIDVFIADVTDLYGYEFKLGYDTSVLTATEIAVGDFFYDYFVWKKEIDQTAGYVWLAVALPPGTREGVSGTGTLATVDFTVEDWGYSALDLKDTVLGEYALPYPTPIPHDVVDGCFSNLEIPFAPEASFTYSPLSPFINESVTFDASGSYDLNGYIVSYEWDFGDGAFGEGVTIGHAYAAAGTYIVTLTVTDNDDLSGTTTVDITVSAVSVHDIAIASLTTFPAGWVGVPCGDPIYINVTVENQGDFSETFSVIVYATRSGDSYYVLIGTQDVSLASGSSKILEFIWDTTDAPLGSYYFSAETSVVPGETDTADNVLINGAFIGGICGARHTPQGVNVLDSLAIIVLPMFAMISLFAAILGFFKIITSVRLRWPWRLSNRAP